MSTTWRDVHHQAQRCRGLQDPAAKKLAAKLWFELCREAIDASAPATRAVAKPVVNPSGAR